MSLARPCGVPKPNPSRFSSCTAFLPPAPSLVSAPLPASAPSHLPVPTHYHVLNMIGQISPLHQLIGV